MNDFPWEQQPAVPMPWSDATPVRALDETVKLLQADVRFIVTHTAVIAHATGPHAAALGMLVNTPRGQLIPTGIARYEGHTIQFQDIGMPQPNAPTMLVTDMCAQLFDVLQKLGIGPEA